MFEPAEFQYFRGDYSIYSNREKRQIVYLERKKAEQNVFLVSAVLLFGPILQFIPINTINKAGNLLLRISAKNSNAKRCSSIFFSSFCGLVFRYYPNVLFLSISFLVCLK